MSADGKNVNFAEIENTVFITSLLFIGHQFQRIRLPNEKKKRFRNKYIFNIILCPKGCDSVTQAYLCFMATPLLTLKEAFEIKNYGELDLLLARENSSSSSPSG